MAEHADRGIFVTRAAGIELEQGLVDEILRDGGDKPGSLALLECTLKRLYERPA